MLAVLLVEYCMNISNAFVQNVSALASPNVLTRLFTLVIVVVLYFYTVSHR